MDLETIRVGIDPVVLGACSLGVVTITELIKKSGHVRDGWGLAVAAVLSALGIGLVGFEVGISSPLAMFLGFSVILSQAAGAWGISRAVSSETVTTVRNTAGAWILIAAIPMSLVACGGATRAARPAMVRADTAIYSTLAAFQDAAISLHENDVIDDETHKRIHAALIPALTTGLEINRVIRAWPQGEPVPGELRLLIEQVGALSRTVIDAVYEDEAKASLMASLATIQDAILAVLVGLQLTPISDAGAPMPGAVLSQVRGQHGEGRSEPDRDLGSGRNDVATDRPNDARGVPFDRRAA